MSLDKNEVTALFYQVSRLMEKNIKSRRKNVNPLSGQYRCLFVLDKVQNISQKRLAAILQIRSTSLSELLSKLEKKNYIVRTPSNEDKRTYFISLTKSGREEVKRVRKIMLKEHDELTKALSDEETEQFFKILTKIKDYYVEMENEMNEQCE